jgi:hypothetical protein
LKKKIKWLFFVLLALIFLVDSASAFEYFDNLSKEKKMLTVNAATGAGIVLWGLSFWEYGQHKPRFESEGWFSEDTGDGGADKLAHFEATYITSHLFSNLYNKWGYENNDSAKLGALPGFGVMGLMELGDSFSEYGFSYEDLIMNGLGSCAAYLLYRYLISVLSIVPLKKPKV